MSIPVASGSRTAPIIITTTIAHGFTTGQLISIHGATDTGGGNYNGFWIITVLSPTTFSLAGSNGVGSTAIGGLCDLPGGTITNATNATPIVVTTAIDHNLQTGMLATITGVLGNLAANGQWIITVLSTTTFSLAGSTGSGNWTSGGTVTAQTSPISFAISDATNASPIVITTTAAHGLASGALVVITGVGGNTAANGNWYIIVTDSTHFSLITGTGANSTGNGNYTSGGFYTLSNITRTTSQLIKERSALVGTGAITLLGPVDGFYPFSILGDGAKATYTITAVDSSGNPTGQAETGYGTYNASSNTVSRDAILSNSDDSGTAENFTVGPKFVTSETQEAITNGTPPDGRFRGSICLSMQARAAINQASREGKGATVYLVPVVESVIDPDPGYVTLLYTANGVGPNGVRTVSRTFLNVQMSRITDPANPAISRVLAAGFSINMRAASAIPFAYNAAVVANQDRINEQVPADVFIYLPSQPPGTALPPAPIMFFLNWKTNGDRGYQLTNPLVPGALISQQGYLDTNSAFITETDPLLKDPQRYLYVGTVCAANSDMSVPLPINAPMYRLLWSRHVRFPFQDTIRDLGVNANGQPETTWVAASLPTEPARNAFMHYSARTQSQISGIQAGGWAHFGLAMDNRGPTTRAASFADMDSPYNPYFRMQCDVLGNVFVRINSINGAPCINQNSNEASDYHRDNQTRATLQVQRCVLNRNAESPDLGFQVWNVIAINRSDQGFRQIYADNVVMNAFGGFQGGQSGPCFFQVSGES